MTDQILTQDLLNSIFDYNSETGIVRWKKKKGRSKANRIAGSKDAYGYICICLDGKTYKAHRLIWVMVNGYFPIEIDHINKVKHDNKLTNLREANRIINNRNHPIRKDNKSGVVGVRWLDNRKKWIAEIRANKVKYYLGEYLNKADAIKARKNGEQEYF